ncbi:MAG: tyrosine-type recombinase/integrase [Beijerinckiaceae bacterium]
MPAIGFTERFISSVAGSGERVDYQDAKIRGLVLRVNSDASRKSWSVTYRRAPDRKRQRITLGTFPTVSLANARAMAQQILVRVAAGDDPAAERRKDQPSVLSVRDLIGEYLARHAAGLRSAKEIERRLRRHVEPAIGATPLEKWHRREAAFLLDQLKVSAPATANRVYDDLKAMSGWAVKAGFLDQNPLAPLERPAQLRKRDRVLSDEEIVRIFAALPTAAMSESMRRIIRLLFLTGCRVSEITGMQRSEVDLRKATLLLPADRVKNANAFTVPLVPAAVEIIEVALQESGTQQFVFPSPSGRSAIEGHAVSVAVRRNRDVFQAGAWTPHDIRRTVATGMGMLGVLPHIVEISLNHLSGFRRGVAGIYNRAAYETEHREALEKWTEHVADIICDAPAGVSNNGKA